MDMSPCIEFYILIHYNERNLDFWKIYSCKRIHAIEFTAEQEKRDMEIIGSVAEVWDWLMAHLLFVNLILSIVIVFFQRRDPKAVWTWLMALYFVPVFGFLFYLLFHSWSLY